MQIKRFATAHWEGSGKEGKGSLSSQSSILQDTQYGFKSRFEDGPGTNPEELIAAAHAGCFSMKLAFNLQGAGFTAKTLDTKATVILENGAIGEIILDCQVSCEGLGEDQFAELAADAKANCPISKLFNATITLNARLV